MTLLTSRPAAWLIIALIVVVSVCAFAQDYQNLDPKYQNLSSQIPLSKVPASALDFTKVSDATGTVNLPLSLLSLGGVDVNLTYSSLGVYKQVRTDNQYAPSSYVGLGWTLQLGSISAEISGTSDTCDDRYFYTGVEGNFELQEDITGRFQIPEYREWRILRVLDSNGKIAGWEITKEDGTICRFGSYDRTLSPAQFSLTGSSGATRCQIGRDGLVPIISPSAYHDSHLSLVPYQWDLSEVQDIGGSLTSLTYQKTEVRLAIPASGGITADSTDLTYTRESHPQTITDNRGTEIRFVQKQMNSNEYFAHSETFNQLLFENKYLDSIYVRRNGQVISIFGFGYQPSDSLGFGITKRYMTRIASFDGSGHSLPPYVFDYYKTSAQNPINPGAIRGVLDPEGGRVIYTYKTTSVSNVALSFADTIHNIQYWDPIYGRNGVNGFMGKDFYVATSSDTLLRVFVRGPKGWCRDNSFPFSKTDYVYVSNDYVILWTADGSGGTAIQLVRHRDNRWVSFNVTAAIQGIGGVIGIFPDVAGCGPNYFVIRHNRRAPFPQIGYHDVSVIMITPQGLKVQTLSGPFYEDDFILNGNPLDDYPRQIRATCSDGYFVLSSSDTIVNSYREVTFSHYALVAGSWVKVAKGDLAVMPPTTQVVTGKQFTVISQYDYAPLLKVYQRNGAAGRAVDSLTSNTTKVQDIVVGDDFYAYVWEPDGSNPYGLRIRNWNGTSFADGPSLQTLFPGDVADGYVNLSGTGNQLIVSFLRLGPTPPAMWKIGRTVYNPKTQTWSQGVIIDSVLDTDPYGGWAHWESSHGVWIDPTTYAHTWALKVNTSDTATSWQPFFVRAYQFQGNGISKLSVDSTALHYPDYFHGPVGWIWQPSGSSFSLTKLMWNGSGSSSRTDSVKLFSCITYNDGSLQFSGVPGGIVVDQRIIASGLGDTARHVYRFENGALSAALTPQYNVVTDSLPGSNGKTVTLLYNELGSGQAQEFVSAKNFLELDGKPYKVKEYSSTNSVIRERNQLWSAEPKDTANGVYFVELLRYSTITDGVPRVIAYEYSGVPQHYQVTKISETNTDGTQRVTRMKYPADFPSTSPTSQDHMVCAIDSMKNVNHMVSSVVEKWIYKKSRSDTSSVVSGTVTKYQVYQAGQILPSQVLSLRDTSVTSFVQSSSTASAFSCDPRYAVSKSIDNYSPYGQIIQERDANGIPTSTRWGYNYQVPVSVARGSYTSETSSMDCEDGTSGDWNAWTMGTISTTHRTGVYGWYHSSSDYKLVTRRFQGSDLVTGGKYVFSGWVKTSSTLPNLLWYVRYNHDSSEAYPTGGVSAHGTGNWEYLESMVDLAPYRNISKVEVYARNGTSSSFADAYWDDLRFYPANGVLITDTYDPLLLEKTSSTDPGSTTSIVSYDGFGRPVQLLNGQGNLIKEYSYYYSRDVNGGNFLSNDPNYVRMKTCRSSTDTTSVKSYLDGFGRVIQSAVSNGVYDIITQTALDSLGRTHYVYKPYQSLLANPHRYDTNFLTNLNSYYSAAGIALGSTPFMETRYMDDPIGRAHILGASGDAFKIGSGHERQLDYLRAADSAYNVTVSRDEQGDSTRVYKDVFGNTVKSVVMMGTDSLLTRFSYDVAGNMTQTTPPLGSSFSSFYKYNTRNEMIRRISPDAGTSQILYDKTGNLRFVRDAAHTGTGTNSVIVSGSVSYGATISSTFAMNNRGRVLLCLDDVGFPIIGSVTMTIQDSAGRATLASIVASSGTVSSSTLLPRGRYIYTIKSNHTGIMPCPYSLTCTLEYGLIYTKFDGLNRPIETGEYESGSGSAAFTQSNADNVVFPTSGNVVGKTLRYDTTSSDAAAVGQHNLRGKLSQAVSYRLGVAAASFSYSYDNMGRVEWIVESGVDTYSKKITYSYDLQGNVTQIGYLDLSNASNNYYIWYEYDAAGRLARVYSGKDFYSRLKDADNSYLASGKLNQASLGPVPAQTVNYTYNGRDWSTKISSTLFQELLGYNDVLFQSTPQYNGNIGWVRAHNASLIDTLGFVPRYDKADRLTRAIHYSNATANNSYQLDTVKYDGNGNISRLKRYSYTGAIMDSLQYNYVQNSNRLKEIRDSVPSSVDPTDIDNQPAGNYQYDDNGSLQADIADSTAFVINNINNLPVSVYRLNGQVIQYWYDHTGQRVKKAVGSVATCYVLGTSGEATAVTDPANSSNPTYYVHGLDLVGRVDKSGYAYSGNYFLKDHLGSIRTTLNGWQSIVTDDFSAGNLAQWSVVKGTNFSVSAGQLLAQMGGENIVVNNTGRSLADGVLTMDVMRGTGTMPIAGIVFRYQDVNNFYFIEITPTNINFKVRSTGTDNLRGTASVGSTIGVYNRYQVYMTGNSFTVCKDGVSVLGWVENGARSSGLVGCYQGGYGNVYFDNVVATTGVSPTSALSYDDYDPWGMVLNGRSGVNGDARARFKFTGKERDLETRYDYFGARYYDARIGRWLATDPALAIWNQRRLLENGLLSISPYQYVRNCPTTRLDPDGFLDKNGNRVFVGVETESYGHAYVYVQDKSGNKTVYSYGRYDGGSGAGTSLRRSNPVGSGVLLKKTGQKAEAWLSGEMKKDGAAVYELKNADGEKVVAHFESQYQSGTPAKKDPDGKVVDTYVMGANTCVNSVLDGLKAGEAGDVANTSLVNTKTGDVSSVPPITPSEMKDTLEKKSQNQTSGVEKQQ